MIRELCRERRIVYRTYLYLTPCSPVDDLNGDVYRCAADCMRERYLVACVWRRRIMRIDDRAVCIEVEVITICRRDLVATAVKYGRLIVVLDVCTEICQAYLLVKGILCYYAADAELLDLECLDVCLILTSVDILCYRIDINCLEVSSVCDIAVQDCVRRRDLICRVCLGWTVLIDEVRAVCICIDGYKRVLGYLDIDVRHRVKSVWRD